MYCSKVEIKRCKTVLWQPGDSNGMLFLIHSGAVGLFTTLPPEDAIPDETMWETPLAIYRHGSFLNPETVAMAPNQYCAVALEDGELLCWSHEQWLTMQREEPIMFSEMLRGVMKQNV